MNFKSFGDDPQSLKLSGDPGLVFVRGINQIEKRLGSNGSGKSSVWDALTWTLYGRTAGGLRNPDVAAWKGGKTTAGHTFIRVDDVKHTIARTANPNRLKIDGVDAGQEAVDRLIGMDFDTFTQTVLFAQGQPLFLDMQPRDKMALFSTVLDLDRWDRRSAAASKRVTELDGEAADVQQAIAIFESTLNGVEDTMKDLRDRSRAWEADRAERYGKIDSEMVIGAKALVKLEKKFADADLAYDGAMTDKRFTETDLAKQQDKLAELRQTMNAAEANFTSMQRELQRYEKELAQLGEGDTCPTCGQSLKGTDLEKHQKEAQKLIALFRKKVDKAMPTKERKAVYDLHHQVTSMREQWELMEKKARDAGVERDALYPRVTEARERIKALEQIKATAEEQANPYNETLQELRGKQGECKNELRDLDKRLVRVFVKTERAKYWVKGFKEIRLFVVDEVMQEMELACNVMLEEMGLIGWQILFDTEKETKSGTIQRGIIVNIVSPSNSKPVRWECWSGGEGQRLRLVGALALAEVLLSHANVDPNIEVLDEPTRHLSSEGVRDMCEYLAQRAEQLGKRIYYTDHQAVESSHFIDTVTIIKDREGSRIE